MRLSRRAATVVAVAIVALILQVNPSFAANVDVPCDTDPGGHCYAERTQGVPLSGPYTLNNVTSATAWVRWDCQSPLDSRTTLVNSEFWVITPVASGGLGDDEWVETGITTGIFSGVGSVSHQFFWAREYWAGTHDQYDEFVIAGTPAAHTSYIVSIKWVAGSGAGTGWRILHGTNDVGGGKTNVAPGANMAVESGAESWKILDGNAGSTSHLSRVQAGTTYNGLTGYLYQSMSAYGVTTTGTSDITFTTPYAHDGVCSTNG